MVAISTGRPTARFDRMVAEKLISAIFRASAIGVS
jgi:hypothetical protein